MKAYDVYGIGNALVDMEFEVDSQFLKKLNVDKGVMTLINHERQEELLIALSPEQMRKRCSGGSAANTMMAIAQLGGKCFYSCKVAKDETGGFFYKDLKEAGIRTNLDQGLSDGGTTGTCVVMVTEDAERTMQTFLGITSTFSSEQLVEEEIKKANYLYIEGYLVASPTGFQAAKLAKTWAKKYGVKTALTFSDINMVKFFRKEFEELLSGGIDLLFANESEAKCYAQTEDLTAAQKFFQGICKNYAITLGERGAVLFDGESTIPVDPYKVEPVDTNGAGDMFAGAFLYGLNHGLGLKKSGQLASMASSRLVTQFGARLRDEDMQEMLRQFV